MGFIFKYVSANIKRGHLFPSEELLMPETNTKVKPGNSEGILLKVLVTNMLLQTEKTTWTDMLNDNQTDGVTTCRGVRGVQGLALQYLSFPASPPRSPGSHNQQLVLHYVWNQASLL